MWSFHRESEATAKAASLIKRKASSMYGELEEQLTEEELQKGKCGRYMGFLKMIGQQGLPILGKAPYYIIVAEQKGIPVRPVARSLTAWRTCG